ncbi:MAG: hypothetical protein WC025_01045 [Candidatus Magasanikbacteria bacterium]
MKYLEIKNNKGSFRRDKKMLGIEQITANDIHNLINHAYEADFEIDKYSEAELPNKAQQIIYESIYFKLNDFLADKEQFNKQVDRMYVDAVGKYGADLEAEFEPDVDYLDNLEQEDVEDDEIDSNDIPF